MDKQDTVNRMNNKTTKEKMQYSLQISFMLLIIYVSVCAAFITSVTSPRSSLISSSSSSRVHSQPNQNNNNEARTAATFELPELKLNLRSMESPKLTTANQIEPSKRVEIEGIFVKLLIDETRVYHCGISDSNCQERIVD